MAEQSRISRAADSANDNLSQASAANPYNPPQLKDELVGTLDSPEAIRPTAPPRISPRVPPACTTRYAPTRNTG